MAKTAEKPAIAEENIKTGPFDVYKYRWWWIGLSMLFLIPGVYFIISNLTNPEIQAPVRLGIDFRGGTLLEYGFSKPVQQSDTPAIRAVFDAHGYTGSVVQIQEPRAGINKQAVEIGAGTTSPLSSSSASLISETKGAPQAMESTGTSAQGASATEQTTATADKPEEASGSGVASIVSIRSKHIQNQEDIAIRQELEKQFGSITLLQKNSIGPSLANELMTNGLLGLMLAYLLIVGYLTFRFQFDFAVCAMLALVHDTIFLFGMFALFGALFHTEIDSLFVTALLTVIGFSVHDTIVVFDRIRENHRIYFTKKVPFVDIVNASVNQTLARSINTSLTALLTMFALYLWGGETTKDFVLAIIIGIAAGTYSSIFIASAVLAMWRNRNQQTAHTQTTAV